LGLSEVGARALGLGPAPWIEPDPVLGYRHVPGAQLRWTEEGDGLIKINSRGHRDAERTLEKPPGTFRIAVLGDSMTEAVQVNLEQTYTQVLERRLREAGHSVEVLNFGLMGYGPLQELLQYRQEVARYRPDVVVLATFLDNDIADCHPALRYSTDGIPFAILKAGSLSVDYSRAEQSVVAFGKQPAAMLRRYSHLYRLLGSWWRRRAETKVAEAGTGIPKRFQLYLKSPPPEWDEAWSVYDAVVGDLETEVKRGGGRLVVFSVPCGQLSDADVWRDQIARRPAMADAAWDLEGPERRLKALLTRRGLPVIQPYRTYRHAGNDPPLFFGGLGHFTARGHELAAEALEAGLRDHACLPR
jgi:hypothetical protein